jgi:hypothetical protein
MRERSLERLSEGLDEEACARLYGEGRMLDLEEVLALAREPTEVSL